MSYLETLSGSSKQRYKEKIKFVSDVDPYENKTWLTDQKFFPTIEVDDIREYLVNTTSFYTRETFKAAKQLGAHNQLTSGWVKSVKTHKPADSEGIIIIGEVSGRFDLF